VIVRHINRDEETSFRGFRKHNTLGSVRAVLPPSVLRGVFLSFIFGMIPLPTRYFIFQRSPPPSIMELPCMVGGVKLLRELNGKGAPHDAGAPVPGGGHGPPGPGRPLQHPPGPGGAFGISPRKVCIECVPRTNNAIVTPHKYQ